MKKFMLIGMLDGWELISAAALFASSLYGFLTSELAAEAEVIAEVGAEVAEDVVEKMAEEV